MSERYYRQNRGFAVDTPNSLQPLIPSLTLDGGLLFTDGTNKLPYVRDLNNWQPRFGAALRLNENTVLRGGFGVMFEPTFDTGNSNGYSTSTSYIASANGNLTPSNSLSNPYPTGIVTPSGSSLGLSTLLRQSFTFANPGRRIPKVYQYSFGIQHQFPWQVVVEAFYAGNYAQDIEVSKGINALPAQYFSLGSAVLNASVKNPLAGLIPSNSALNAATTAYQNLLLPYSEFGITDANNSVGTRAYNSLQVTGQKRLSAGLQMRASFTWDKDMGRTSYLNNQDPFNALARAQTQEPNLIFVLSGSYALPIFAKSTGVAHSLLGGWNLNAVIRKQSGYRVPAPTGAFSTGVNPKLSDPTYSQWFNTCTLNASGVRTNCASASQPVAWTIQPAFTLNEYITNYSYLPGIRSNIPPEVDLSLFKRFALWESGNLEFRAEAYNLTNTPAFGFPNTSVTSSAFGLVTLTQTNDPRLIQLALKLNL